MCLRQTRWACPPLRLPPLTGARHKQTSRRSQFAHRLPHLLSLPLKIRAWLMRRVAPEPDGDGESAEAEGDAEAGSD